MSSRHCIRCQNDTGSAHAANLFAKASTLTWLKGEKSIKKNQIKQKSELQRIRKKI